MTNRFNITVPVTYTSNGAEMTSYRRVGVAFLNDRADGSGQVLNIKLDFPVAVDELVGFEPKAGDQDGNVTE
ncbi:hypothetical protein [Cognatiyoonia sp. IB215182]|uniref:hypothetical protein n=1 Tax=Cognatiyoonia sp. IB215182 TaxID=3097353 RepID=UPI002A17BE84|nr:hypothetical protein [Cognatiyoonia sp. IB215182]MDX8355281.1 hypothetical protein [Cognatiyoonia sp. IB215182]